jgi:hypothetical protein
MNRTIVFLVFLITVLVLCAGAFGIGRWVAPANPSDVGRRPGWTPPGSASPAPVVHGATATPTLSPTRAPSTVPAPTPSRVNASATPTIDTKDQFSQTPTAVVSPSPTVTATSAPATRRAEYAFELVRPVRSSSGDCPGSYILGSVIDPAGKPMPDVSLRLTDEYGNQQTQTTKKVASESGRYDFPLFGPPRRFFLSVIDPQGRPLSPVVEIPHGVGSTAEAKCHWADWQRQ